MPRQRDLELLRPTDIARQYRVGRSRVQMLCRTGELPHLRIGRRILIPRREFVKWVERQVVATNASSTSVTPNVKGGSGPTHSFWSD